MSFFLKLRDIIEKCKIQQVSLSVVLQRERIRCVTFRARYQILVSSMTKAFSTNISPGLGLIIGLLEIYRSLLVQDCNIYR